MGMLVAGIISRRWMCGWSSSKDAMGRKLRRMCEEKEGCESDLLVSSKDGVHLMYWEEVRPVRTSCCGVWVEWVAYCIHNGRVSSVEKCLGVS